MASLLDTEENILQALLTGSPDQSVIQNHKLQILLENLGHAVV
jgi:predicted regulator of Ras-like GTPase activity (Roadblock/LC7/MglB family)